MCFNGGAAAAAGKRRSAVYPPLQMFSFRRPCFPVEGRYVGPSAEAAQMAGRPGVVDAGGAPRWDSPMTGSWREVVGASSAGQVWAWSTSARFTPQPLHP
jgi:hypothetical protein